MSRLSLLMSYLRASTLRFPHRAALEAWQERQVRRHLAWVLPRSPYTRARFGDRPPSAWRGLPPIEKSQMMAHFSELNTLGIPLDEAMEVALRAERSRDFSPLVRGTTVGLSSGTSGHRGLFLVPEAERQLWAGSVLHKLLPHSLLWPRRDRIAFFLRANSRLYEATHSRRVSFTFFDLQEELHDQLDRLKELDPTLLIAPPSTLRRLASRQPELKLRPIKIIAVAEVLDPLDERLIRRAFQQTVHQVYQATEGFLGHTCSWGTLHLAEDVMVIQREAVGSGRFVPVITDFRRRAQPMIRHRLNDVLRLRPSPCRCGSPLTALASIEGRDDDVFVGQRTDGSERPIFADFIRRAVLLAPVTLTDYGVRQTAPDHLELFTDPPTHGPVAQSLREMFEQLSCRAPTVEALTDWPQGGMRKRKRVVRSFVWEEPQ